jgi:hypothetical protein
VSAQVGSIAVLLFAYAFQAAELTEGAEGTNSRAPWHIPRERARIRTLMRVSAVVLASYLISAGVAFLLVTSGVGYPKWAVAVALWGFLLGSSCLLASVYFYQRIEHPLI